ncbi:MAG: peptide chain release factor N(5)-glutamine methyltransferase [Spirochaetaceae bacterium]|nr:MAG: peptide chain release factor N(5)-glutamine methyltransferase [Spirochaetaceae bacterium]
MITVGCLLKKLQRDIQSDTPALDASLIIAKTTGLSRESIYLNLDRELSATQADCIEELCKRRNTGEPIAYLLGKKEFFGKTFIVDHRVLIPRPDTEILVETAIKQIDNLDDPISVLDLCCGSGCAGISVAANRPNINLEMADIDSKALEVAEINARRLLPEACKYRIVESDLFQHITTKYDIIITNPPYISAKEYEVLRMECWREPRHALVAEDDGLEIIGRIADIVKDYLKPGGWVMIEAADHQAVKIADMLHSNGFLNVESILDLSGKRRVTVGKANNEVN